MVYFEGGDNETVEDCGFDYLDHPADVQVHAWGRTFNDAIEMAALSISGFMTDINAIQPLQEFEIEEKANDYDSLIFQFLSAVLDLYHTQNNFLAKEIEVDLNSVELSIRAKCRGDLFTPTRHPAGTEIKAITYSNLQIIQGKNSSHIYVILDI